MKLTITIFLSLLAIGSLTFSNAQKNKGADKETIIGSFGVFIFSKV